MAKNNLNLFSTSKDAFKNNLYSISQTELKLRNSLLHEDNSDRIDMKLKIADKLNKQKNKIVNIMNTDNDMFAETEFNINEISIF